LPDLDPTGGRRDRGYDYPANTVESSAEVVSGASRGRVGSALRRRKNWEQLVKFCLVGAAGYAVNLWVFSFLVLVLGIHYIPAAVCSFLVAVTNNYLWNRTWTFRRQRGHLVFQGFRFLLVSTVALAANLVFLGLLVAFGVPKLPAQAIAIVLVTPWNFVANKLWSFRRRRG
jgi:putative flippase GtrA